MTLKALLTFRPTLMAGALLCSFSADAGFRDHRASCEMAAGSYWHGYFEDAASPSRSTSRPAPQVAKVPTPKPAVVKAAAAKVVAPLDPAAQEAEALVKWRLAVNSEQLEDSTATLLLRWELGEAFRDVVHGPLTQIKVIEGNELSPVAKLIFGRIAGNSDGTLGLPPEKLQALAAILRHAPEIEQTLSYVVVPKSIIESNAPGISFQGRDDEHKIVYALKGAAALHIFVREDLNTALKVPSGFVVMMAPSWSMLQSYGDLIFDGDFPKLKAEIGVSPLARMLDNMMQGFRPMGFIYPKAPDTTADGVPTNGYGFTIHDYFHNFKKAPRKVLAVLARTATLIQRLEDSGQEDHQKRSLTLAEGLVKVEFGLEPKMIGRPNLFSSHLIEVVADLLRFDATKESLSESIRQVFGSVEFGASQLTLLDQFINPDLYQSWGISREDLTAAFRSQEIHDFYLRLDRRPPSEELRKLFEAPHR